MREAQQVADQAETFDIHLDVKHRSQVNINISSFNVFLGLYMISYTLKTVIYCTYRNYYDLYSAKM